MFRDTCVGTVFAIPLLGILGLKWDNGKEHYIPLSCAEFARIFTLRTLGGTPNRDPCSLWGLIWGLPRDRGVI